MIGCTNAIRRCQLCRVDGCVPLIARPSGFDCLPLALQGRGSKVRVLIQRASSARDSRFWMSGNSGLSGQIDTLLPTCSRSRTRVSYHARLCENASLSPHQSSRNLRSTSASCAARNLATTLFLRIGAKIPARNVSVSSLLPHCRSVRLSCSSLHELILQPFKSSKKPSAKCEVVIEVGCGVARLNALDKSEVSIAGA